MMTNYLLSLVGRLALWVGLAALLWMLWTG